MADDSGGSMNKRRKKDHDVRKLLPGEKIEVLYTDEGLNGSWHGGVVVEFGERSRLIEYTDLLSDNNSSKLVEQVPVSAAIEGSSRTTPRNHRGHIRPSPPQYEFRESEIRYGLCVDAWIDDAWWEGVVFDHEESSVERLVFFPDQGDQQKVTIDQLRLTQEWNEVSGIWKARGEWLLLQVLGTIEQDGPLPVSIREIWYDLRTTTAFSENIGVWVFGSHSVWVRLVSELIKELLSVARGLLLDDGTLSNQLIDAPLNISNGKSNCLDCSGGSTEKEAVLASKRGVRGRDDRSLYDVSESNPKQGFCPQSVSNYIEFRSSFTDRPAPSTGKCTVLGEMALHDLLALDWKLKLSDDNRKIRKYYFSPGGTPYRSLIKACEACQQMAIQYMPNHSKSNNLICNEQGVAEAKQIRAHKKYKLDCSPKSTSIKHWQPLDLEPVFCPEVIKSCTCNLKERKAKMEKSKAANHNLERSRAKQHLLALGWKIDYRRDTSWRFSFLSPEGKRFYSLRKACCHLLIGHQKGRKSRSNYSDESTSLVRSCPLKKKRPQIVHSSQALMPPAILGNNALKRTSYQFSNFKKFRKQKALKAAIGVCHKSSFRSSLRSSKKSREVVPHPFHHIARTVLSLLIDNDMVLPRQKVSYIRKRDGHVMMEGRITRDGIKCKCCKKVYTLTNFEAHAGSSNHRPAANIILEDGRSLLECQMQMVQDKKPKDLPHTRLKSDRSIYRSDTICSVCHNGGILVLCDHCPSSFHLACVGLEEVPKGKWFCPSCRCGICGLSDFNSDTEQFTDKTVLYCDQCEREYHVGCLKKRGSRTLRNCPDGNWFCSKKCSKIFIHLRKLLGKSKPTTKEDFSWTILRSSKENGVDCDQFDAETKAEHDSKLCVALDVLHECFVSIIEPRTKSDLVADLVFNKESELKRLNFWGFYTLLLERGDELISVATFRVYGEKVAEMPLIGTRVQYRRQGMCRLLVNELEKLLSALGVERLMLPAVPQLLQAWTKSFGFTKMTSCDRLGFLEYSLLNFQDTAMCQKLLKSVPAIPKKLTGISNTSTDAVSEVEPIKCLPSLAIDACSSLCAVEGIDYQTNGTHSTCTDLVLQSVDGKMTSPNVDSGKHGGRSVVVEAPPIAVLKQGNALKFKSSSDKQYQLTDASKDHLNRSIVRAENTFKYFYRRRISAN